MYWLLGGYMEVCISYSVDVYGECVENGVGSVEYFYSNILC